MGCVLLLVAVSPLHARLTPAAPDDLPLAARAVLERVAVAFLDGDHEALAALVHPDGVRLGLGPDPERITELTPGQSHYYFKALFRSSHCIAFDYQRHQATADARVLARAVWRVERHDRGDVELRRLLVTLARHPDGWRLTELTALRGG
jgi:hypothetical protein